MSNHTMKAIRIHEFGGPDQLALEDVPRPEPQANEVLLRVKAAGVNPADWKMRAGYYQKFMPLPLPWTPGLEASGIVEAVGADVTGLQAGQAVYGLVNNAYAEYAVAPADQLVLKSDKLTFDEAAGIPMGALTAWQAVIEDGAVQAGQRVLVQGAAGGVGHYAVQFACWQGADVIGTASEGNFSFCRSIGAKELIDYRSTPFESVVSDVDVVIDTVGADVPERSWQVLKPGGLFVTVASQISPDDAAAHGVRAMMSRRAAPEKLKDIAALIEEGKVVPAVGEAFSLAQASEAHELSQTGHGRGRIILHVAD